MKIQTIQAIRGLLTSQQCTFTGNQFGVLSAILFDLQQEEQELAMLQGPAVPPKPAQPSPSIPSKRSQKPVAVPK